MKAIIAGVVFVALMIARYATAQMVVQPGVQGGLIVAVPLSGNSTMIVQPGTFNPPAFVVGLSEGSALIVQPPVIPYVAPDTDAAGIDDGSNSDGSDGDDTDGGSN